MELRNLISSSFTAGPMVTVATCTEVEENVKFDKSVKLLSLW
jgi:hypothetical protein